jgi:uncharacterized membrane protein HdeD (DUF308 family)
MLFCFALFGAVTALDSLAGGGRWIDILLMLGFLFGAVGVLGLWVAAFRRKPPIWMLVTGILGAACGYVTLPLGTSPYPFLAVLFMLPVVVAVIHISIWWQMRSSSQDHLDPAGRMI